MKKHDFTFHTVDFADDSTSVWVAAYVDDDTNKNVGAYINADGRVELNDHVDWCIDNDFAKMGMERYIGEAMEIENEWVEAAREYGLSQIDG